MSIGLKTHKLLWGRSGNKCAFEDCRHDLIADETETDDESVIGDEAHIVAKSPDGPRGNSPLTEEERDKYDNLILLCRKHHKIIDDQFNFYTVDKLTEVKRTHEKWVKESLTIDVEKNKIDLTYATYIDEIVSIVDFQNWNAWTSWILGGGQSIGYLKLKELEKFASFAITRFWPGEYKELENAVFNLKEVLNDFLKVFYKHVESKSLEIKEDEDLESKGVYTERFYKLIFHEDESVYHRLLDEYNFHVALVNDLALELTRAGNLLIEKIRKYISPMYRDKEGKLLITTGPDMDFSYKSYKVEYRGDEKKQTYPYPGLEKFMVDREKRDLCFGTGLSKKYLPFDPDNFEEL
jgi:hypothetical protein